MTGKNPSILFNRQEINTALHHSMRRHLWRSRLGHTDAYNDRAGIVFSRREPGIQMPLVDHAICQKQNNRMQRLFQPSKVRFNDARL